MYLHDALFFGIKLEDKTIQKVWNLSMLQNSALCFKGFEIKDSLMNSISISITTQTAIEKIHSTLKEYWKSKKAIEKI